jgi:hypothetical protein
VATTDQREAGLGQRLHLASKRLACTAVLTLFATLLCGAAVANADGTIPAIGVNSIQSDGILLPNDDWNGLGELDFASQAGVQLYRARIQLNCVDPNHTGTFNFTAPSASCYGLSYDALVGALAAHGMTLLPVLMNFDGNTPQPPTPDGANGSPTTAEFAAFAAAAVARYGPGGTYWAGCGCTPEPIQSWEIWNEENNGYWWDNDASASGYAAVFDATRTALRSADPQARVVVGGLTWASDGQSFVRPEQIIAALSANNANAFDAVAVHPYTKAQGDDADGLANSAIAYINEMAADLIENTGRSSTGGPRQQIWVTEMGWSDTQASPTTIAGGFEDFIADLNKTARAQDNIGPIVWYMLSDNSTITTRADGLGLLYTSSNGSDAGPKPIWPVFAAAAQSEGTIALPAALGDSGPYLAPTTKGASGAKGAKSSKEKSLVRCVKVGRRHHKRLKCTRIKKHAKRKKKSK